MRRRILQRSWWPLALAVAGLLMLTGATCSDTPEGEFVTAESLAAQPASALIYPGTTVISSGGRDAANNLTGSTPAFYTHRIGSDAAKDDIIAWHDDELRALGYGPGQRSSRATTDLEAWQWWKADLRFRLAIQLQGENYTPADQRGQHRTIYETHLHYLPATE